MARVSLGSVLKPFQSGPRERPGQSPLRGTPSCQVAQPGEREDQGARACVRAGEAQGVGRGGAWSRVIFPVTSAELAGDAWPGLPGSVWKFKCSQGRQESQGRVGFGAAWRLPWPGGQPAALRRTQPSLPLRDRPLVLPGPTGSQGGQQRPGGLAHSHPHAPCAMSPTSQQPGEDIQELSTLCPGTPSVRSVSSKGNPQSMALPRWLYKFEGPSGVVRSDPGGEDVGQDAGCPPAGVTPAWAPQPPGGQATWPEDILLSDCPLRWTVLAASTGPHPPRPRHYLTDPSPSLTLPQARLLQEGPCWPRRLSAHPPRC